MIEVLKFIGFLLLFGIGLLSGGCSLIFTPIVFSDGASPFLLFWLAGIGIAAGCIWGIKVFYKNPNSTNIEKGNVPDDER